MEKYLIVGLGNPGVEYKNTRHQIGFMVIDEFAKKYNLTFKPSNFNGEVSEFAFANKKIYLAKPTTFMNLSGEFVLRFSKYYQIDVENILILYDDVSIPIGTYRLRKNGSSGGHNGIKSLISCLNTEDIKRLKIGIMNPETFKSISLKDYVLGKFNTNEQEILSNIFPTLNEIILNFFNIDFEKLLAKYNKK